MFDVRLGGKYIEGMKLNFKSSRFTFENNHQTFILTFIGPIEQYKGHVFEVRNDMCLDLGVQLLKLERNKITICFP